MVKVLCIGYEPEVADIIRLVLERKGYTVTAINGHEKMITEVQVWGPDLVIITGTMMRPWNGYEIIRRLRADPILGDIPIILLSARHSPELEKDASIIGANEYIVKPFIVRELLEKIGRIFSNYQI
jgi:CheY-like chemotaxis protein